jgi:hypothetical protein
MVILRAAQYWPMPRLASTQLWKVIKPRDQPPPGDNITPPPAVI